MSFDERIAAYLILVLLCMTISYFRYSYWTSFTILISTACVILFRDTAAASDYQNYIQMYNSSGALFDALAAYHGDFVFSFVMYISNKMGISGDNFIRTFPIIVLFTIWVTTKRFIPSSTWALFFGSFVLSEVFIFFSVNVLRQGLAATLLYPFILSVYNRNWPLSILLASLSIFSHDSALIPVVIIFLSYYLANNKHYGSSLLLVIPLSILVFIFSSPISAALSHISPRFEHYLNYTHESNTYAYRLVIQNIIGVISIAVFTKFKTDRNMGLNFVLLSIISLIAFSNATYSAGIVSSRVLYYSIFLSPIVYSVALHSARMRFDAKLYFLIWVLYCLSFYMYGNFMFGFESVRGQLVS